MAQRIEWLALHEIVIARALPKPIPAMAASPDRPFPDEDMLASTRGW
ncbi:MAG: hypothetical protein SGI84_13110 [Gemmatimonadota bacterium]|nr:hypothetical protein [Gemmatimonadota bacterium]